MVTVEGPGFKSRSLSSTFKKPLTEAAVKANAVVKGIRQLFCQNGQGFLDAENIAEGQTNKFYVVVL